MSLTALNNLKTLVANCDKWQDMVGAANAAAALADIVLHGTSSAGNSTVMMLRSDSWDVQKTGTGPENTHGYSGTILARVHLYVTGLGDDWDTDQATAWADVEELVEEMLELSGTGGYLEINSVNVGEPRWPAPDEDDQGWLDVELRIAWGTSG